jgi:membrane-bound lytic murein transglycosylase D
MDTMTGRATLLALGLAVLPSCAGKQVRTLPQPAPAPPPQAEPVPFERAGFDERLERIAREFEEGVDLLAVGDEVGGEFKIANASNDLRDAAAGCESIPGCGVEPILDVVDRLLAVQSIAIKQQAYRLDTMEASIERDVEREPGTSPFVSSMPELGRTVSLLKGTDLRDLIVLNAPVQAAIDDWLTWMRPMLLDSYENYRYLRSKVAPVYEEAGLPEALLFAMMATESGVKVHSFSRAGAAGPLQFMPGTGRRYGLSVENGFDTRLDPVAATRANVAYLNDQFNALNDSLEKALAAYNGGENRMQALERRHNGASLWDSEVYYSLPGETREYVPRILAAAWLFLHPEDYGLEFPEADPTTTRIELREDIALGELSVCLGQAGNARGWFRTLRNLNPRYEPGERIPAGTSIEVPVGVAAIYERRCLEGELLGRARELHEASNPRVPELVPYTVRRGDTLGRIASRHTCVTVGELAALNDIRPPRFVIHEGQRLKLPSCR